MPKIMAEGKTFEVAKETNLRAALLAQDIALYSAGAKIFNCHGHGICGTCLVEVEGLVSEPTKMEKIRISFPSHSDHLDRRLACKVKVLSDVWVTKFDGYFGEGESLLWTPEQGSMNVPEIAS